MAAPICSGMPIDSVSAGLLDATKSAPVVNREESGGRPSLPVRRASASLDGEARRAPKTGQAKPLIQGQSRGDRRVGAVIEAVWRDGGRFDGWSEHFSYDRWMRCAGEALAGTGVDVAWYTTRERDFDEVLPWDHLDSGLDKDWLWQDWEDALDETEVEDCRWTPCFDCGVCPDLGTEIQVGPTGRQLLPPTPV